MSADYLVTEPFPSFVDTSYSSSNGYFSKMSTLSILNSPQASNLRKSIAIPTRIQDYIKLRYYQYEVTFGLYVMTPGEKLVLNSIVLSIFLLLAMGLYYGLQPFLIRTICRMLWYLTGSHEGVENICA